MINDEEIPMQTIDNTFSCNSDSKVNEFNFENKYFKNTKSVEWVADVAVFFSLFYNKESTVIAYASSCRFESSLNFIKKQNRSEIGKIMFNLANINIDSDNEYAQRHIINTATHEIFHILGFS